MKALYFEKIEDDLKKVNEKDLKLLSWLVRAELKRREIGNRRLL